MNDLSHFGEAGIALMGLFSALFGNADVDDKEFIESHELIQKVVSSGKDFKLDPDDPESYTSHELREQLTPEQMEELDKEYQLRKMGKSRN